MADDLSPRTGLIGATSFVGGRLMAKLASKPENIVAFSRRPPSTDATGIKWVALDDARQLSSDIQQWFLLAPIWAMPAYFDMMARLGARSVVALSSTSVATKVDSSDAAEKAMIQRMLAAEEALQVWARKNGIQCTILRPTLIYGRGKDKNLSEIARLIRKLRVFPLLGPAAGKRQPIHVDDVAQACLSAMHRKNGDQTVYVISGAEVLPYHEMVRRIFAALSLPPLFVRIPGGIFQAVVKVMNVIPRYRNWTPAMAERMNLDMAFSHEDAERDFGFKPRGFNLTREDLP